MYIVGGGVLSLPLLRSGYIGGIGGWFWGHYTHYIRGIGVVGYTRYINLDMPLPRRVLYTHHTIDLLYSECIIYLLYSECIIYLLYSECIIDLLYSECISRCCGRSMMYCWRSNALRYLALQ